MKNENSLLLSYFIIVVLLACTAYFLNENNLLRMQLADRESELAAVHAEMGAKDIFVIEAKQELMDFRRNVTEVQLSVDDSREWFIGNSRMPDSLGNFTSEVKTGCVENGTFFLGCIEAAMDRSLGFRFRTEWTDRLYSIDEMLQRKGGDCDDYTLFAMALLNTMKEDGVQADLGAREEAGWLWQSEDEGYSSSAGGEPAMDLGSLQSVYPIAMCYTISSRDEEISGHCINVLSPAPIGSVDDLEKLNGSLTFDPQNGEFTGVIGEDFHICREGDDGCELRRDSANIIMTEADIYKFKDGEWGCFGKYGGQMDTVLGAVDSTLARARGWE